jgi:hypothetical protein
MRRDTSRWTKRWYSISQSTRLQAIERFGHPDMRMLPPDEGPGYVWRLYSFSRLEESDGGVYIELEAVGLSRDVPIVFRWLVQPILEHLPRNSIHKTLEETRNAVLMRIGRVGDAVPILGNPYAFVTSSYPPGVEGF